MRRRDRHRSGTTNTVVAAVVDGVAVTLRTRKASACCLPSCRSRRTGRCSSASPRAKRLTDPENTIFSVKPLLGRSWDSDETQNARQRFPFKLVQGAKNATMVHARDSDYALPEISAFVLRRAKAIAEQALKQPVEKAVITVPANFNDLQRASTKIASKLARPRRHAHPQRAHRGGARIRQSIKAAEKIAIHDLGGGTFDITLLDLTDSVFEVLGTAGDTALGGDDIDRLIADRIIKDVPRLRIDPRSNASSLARISFLAEVKMAHERRCVRSRAHGRRVQEQGDASLDRVQDDAERARGNGHAAPQTDDRRLAAIDGRDPALRRDFSRVILVGGATRMPLVSRVVEALFGKPPSLR